MQGVFLFWSIFTEVKYLSIYSGTIFMFYSANMLQPIWHHSTKCDYDFKFVGLFIVHILNGDVVCCKAQ